MAYLTFISDKDLISAIRLVISKAHEIEESDADITRNQLDPFGAFFECAAGKYSLEEWTDAERARQAQKSIQNTIGDFHQALIGSLKGCQPVPRGKGLDVLNIEQGWCAEIKNKFNTTKGNHKPRLYDDIEKWVTAYTTVHKRQFTGYYVQIIPSKPNDLDQPFTPSDGGERRPSNKYIREISGALFYEKITGEKNALLDLYKVLPSVLKNEFDITVPLNEQQLVKLFRDNIKR